MTNSQIKALAAQLMRADVSNFAVDLATGDGKSTPDADLQAQVNAAYHWLALQVLLTRADVALNLLANQYKYILDGAGFDAARVSHRCLKVRQVTVGGVALLDYARKPGLVSLDEMNALASDWQGGGVAGTVVRAMQVDNVLWVNPKPLADATGLILAQYIPTDLTGANDVPDLATPLHEVVAMAAAAYAGTGTASDDVVWRRIGAYNGKAQELAGTYAARNAALLGLDSYTMAQKGETP